MQALQIDKSHDQSGRVEEVERSIGRWHCVVPCHCALYNLMACFPLHDLRVHKSDLRIGNPYGIPRNVMNPCPESKLLTVPAPLTKRFSISLAACHTTTWHLPWQWTSFVASKLRSRASEACSMSNLATSSSEFHWLEDIQKKCLRTYLCVRAHAPYILRKNVRMLFQQTSAIGAVRPYANPMQPLRQ